MEAEQTSESKRTKNPPPLRGININGLMMMQYKAGFSLWKDPDADTNMFGKSSVNWDPEGPRRCVGDDYSLSLELGPEETQRRLGGHLETYITEKDISWMAHHGINHIRVQTHYWMVYPQAPFRNGTFAKLEQIFEWCEKYNVGVFLAYFGAEGCQNAAQSCGSCMKYTNCKINDGDCNTYRESEHVSYGVDFDGEIEAGRAFRSEDNQACGESWPLDEYYQNNVAVLTNLTTHFKDSPVYLGMIFTNEPAGLDKNDRLFEFYRTMQKVIRTVNGPDTLVTYFNTNSPNENLADSDLHQPHLDKHLFSDSGHFHYQVFPDMEENIVNEMDVGEFIEPDRHWKYLIHAWSLTWGDAGVLSSRITS